MGRPTAFGMTGSGGSIAFADREHGFAFAYTQNRLVGRSRGTQGRLVNEARSALGLAAS
jgi:CubicO group peptidase (beta-lactamase class C family)